MTLWQNIRSFQICNVNEFIVTNYQKGHVGSKLRFGYTLDRLSVVLCCVKASSGEAGVKDAEK